MSEKNDFGQFIFEQQQKYSMKSAELARKLGISAGYLSQLEHGKRVCPDVELLKKLIVIFDLNMKEATVLYDLYASASGKLCPDIAEYVISNDIVKKALRCAGDVHATEEDWEKFITFLKNKYEMVDHYVTGV